MSDETLDVVRLRREFGERLRKRLDEMGVPAKEQATWLSEQLGVRWQTAQYWVRGRTYPHGHHLSRLEALLGVELLPGIVDAGPRPPGWEAFLETPEAGSMTETERRTLRFFGWPQPATADDYRMLLALLRVNASRS